MDITINRYTQVIALDWSWRCPLPSKLNYDRFVE